jgi:glycosyltransferase involved in cell wall biosynthesis
VDLFRETPYSVASVVIPAHDEQAVIERCLRALATGARPGELDVIVVANACRDDTAEVARAAGVKVVETPVPGKAHALDLGDRHCVGFPRLYLDADIELTADAVRRMADSLVDDGALACAPAAEFDITGASWAARRYHLVLDRLRGERATLSGAGAYMLTEAGHDRVFPMPDIIADDAWVHRKFDAEERVVVDSARVSVRLPRTVPSVIRRRARVRLGNRQLDRLGCPATEAPLSAGALRGLLRRHEIGVLDAVCFLMVLVAERVIARWREARGTHTTWSSDQTTRVAATPER